MALHPQVEALLARMAAAGGGSPFQLPPDEARAASVRSAPLLSGPGEEVAAVADRTAPGPDGPVPVRVYTPATGAAPRPVLVYLHGGGFVVGSLDTYDPLCRALANRSGAVVVSVGYRLAPEHPWPAAVRDAAAAAAWVRAHAAGLGGDDDRVGVGGDSAGANLATIAARHVRGLAFQVLVYPVTDAAMDTPSYEEFAEGHYLSRDDMRVAFDHYLPAGVDRRHPDVAPLHAPDLAGLPPTLVITAAADPLRDEGEAYADRLRAAGVPVTVSRYDGMVHGFFRWTAVVEAATTAIDEVAAFVRAAGGAQPRGR